jgi:hypothetical protein
MFRIAVGLVVVCCRRVRRWRSSRSGAAAPNPFVFPGDGGVVLNFVKADKAADFEMVLGKVKEALAKSTKPERKAQLNGWKVFKASETRPDGGFIYVFVFDPAQKGGDYSVGNILVEAFGAEGQTLTRLTRRIRQSGDRRVAHLNKVADFGQ